MSKQKIIVCRKCGCELSYKELQGTRLCFICERNEFDRQQQRFTNMKEA